MSFLDKLKSIGGWFKHAAVAVSGVFAKLVGHDNAVAFDAGATRLSRVALRGGPRLDDFDDSLGVRQSGKSIAPMRRTGARVAGAHQSRRRTSACSASSASSTASTSPSLL